MNMADKGLNSQALAIEEAQTKIRLAVRDGWLAMRPKQEINRTVQTIIQKALREIRIADLRDAAYRSLNAFAERQYNTYRRLQDEQTKRWLLLWLSLEEDSVDKKAQRSPNMKKLTLKDRVDLGTQAKGVPLNVYAKDYFRQKVEPVFEEILRQKALDPDDISGSNTLRNRAEMEVRYDDHLRQIKDFRAAGVKLVTCSVHADCSDRCYKWQGRVYSLDGTSGRTEDGKPYIPLERATDIFYTTKAGKVYKNGLLGFNCRHYLMPYKPGMVIPHVSKETQQRENKINTKQRELERIVRKYREDALFYKNLNRKWYLEVRRKAIAANKAYIKFSHDNGRAYYPSRVELL